MTTPAPAPRRRTKALVAGSLGVLLLAAGGGTFAAWQDKYTFEGGDISSGTLTIEGANAAWKLNERLLEGGVGDVELVPGDTLTYTETVTTTVEGDNLTARLSTNFDEWFSADPDSQDLKEALSVELEVTDGPVSEIVSATDGYRVPQGRNNYDVELTITLPSTVADTTGQGDTVTLNAVEVTLAQELPGASSES